MAEEAFAAALLAMGGIIIGVFVLIALAVYIYSCFALMTIGKKLNTNLPSWMAWVPFVNIYYTYIISKADPKYAWGFLGIIIPFVGQLIVMVLMIYIFWKLAESRKYPGALALLNIVPLLGPIIFLGLLAWRDN